MAKIVVLARCQDQAKWESGFRTHGEFFRRAYGVSKPVSYGMGDDNLVGVCMETDDVAKAMSALALPETAEAMKGDGLLRDTVQVLVMDKELAI